MRKTCTVFPGRFDNTLLRYCLPRECFLQFPSCTLGNNMHVGKYPCIDAKRKTDHTWPPISLLRVSNRQTFMNWGKSMYRTLHRKLIIVAFIKNVFLYLGLWIQGFFLFQDGVRLENSLVLTSSMLQWHKQNVKYINLYINASNVANRVDNIKWGKTLDNHLWEAQ